MRAERRVRSSGAQWQCHHGHLHWHLARLQNDQSMHRLDYLLSCANEEVDAQLRVQPENQSVFLGQSFAYK